MNVLRFNIYSMTNTTFYYIHILYIYNMNITNTTFYYSNSTLSVSSDTTLSPSSYLIPSGYALVSVNISNIVTILGVDCFNNCSSLTAITIPSSVVRLDLNCFNNCSSLTAITIPSNVTKLDDNCFYNCINLNTINFLSSNTISAVGTLCFSNTHSNIIVNYYNAFNYSSLSSALQSTQSQFSSPTLNYIYESNTIGSTEFLNPSTTLNTESINFIVNRFENSIVNTPYNEEGIQYAQIPGYTNAIAQISINAFDSSGNPVTDFTSNPLQISLFLPMADTNHSILIYKLVTGTINLVSPQPSGYPVQLTYNQSTLLWTGSMTSLSDVILLDAGLSCFIGYNKVLMGNGLYKQIKDIIRGDIIMTDTLTNKTNKVAKIYCIGGEHNCIKIVKDLIGNHIEIICSENHPFWINNNSNRILAKNIPNALKIKITDILYNIQFEDESTYYIEGIRVDSLSPYHRKYPLDTNLFFNKEKYIEKYVVKNEDDPKRNKPKMTNIYTIKN